MPHHALVIGVDAYKLPGASLKGAVRDALAMRAWLADPAGGNVPEANIRLLLSRSATSPNTTANFREATLDEIFLAIGGSLKAAGGSGDRFYFYFAGHGLTAPGDFDHDTLLPGDFLPALFFKSITVESILEAFKASAFDLQFFFIDACRDVPFPGKFTPSRFSPQPDIKDKRAVEQFVYLATSQGAAAREDGEEGSEQGAFTSSLLRGLGGAGSAKKYNALEDAYEVTADSLRDYVVAEVKHSIEAIDDPEERALVRPPVLRGQRSTNPVLASFDRAAVPPVHLSVTIKPPAARKETRLIVLRESKVHEQKPPVGASVKIPLPPMEYRLQASATHFATEERFYKLPLYQDLKQEITLKALPKGAKTASVQPPVTPGRRGGAVTPIPPNKGILRATAADSMGILEILDGAGRVRASGFDTVTLRLADPGPYTARMTLPGGHAVEELVFLDAGREEVVHLHAPAAEASPVTSSLHAQFHQQQDNSLHLSESLELGNVASPAPIELLSLAAFAETCDPAKVPAQRLRTLGLQSLRELPPATTEAVYVIAASETGPRMVDASTDPQALLPLTPRLSPGFLAEIAAPLLPGDRWLHLCIDQAVLRLPLPALPGLLHTVILHWNERDELTVARYLGPLRLESNAIGRDARTRRRLDLALRYQAEGLLKHALATLIPANGFGPEKEILGQWRDPIAGCLAAYLLLHLETGVTPHLQRAAAKLPEHFPQLSDAHIVAAEVAFREGRVNEAGVAYNRAAEAGYPVFAQGADLLASRGIDLEKRRPGEPWTML